MSEGRIMTDSKISLERRAPSREELTGYYNPKSKQNGNVGARCIVPTGEIR